MCVVRLGNVLVPPALCRTPLLAHDQADASVHVLGGCTQHVKAVFCHAGVKQVRPSNKAVAALQKKSEPAENWQGFKTKGLKKTTAGAAVKSVSAGQRPVAGKRKAPEKRASVAARKQKGKPGKG